MPTKFIKTIACGCVVKSVAVGIKRENGKIYYLIGGHEHLHCCAKCQVDENNDVDTLHDMWMNDSIKDPLINDGWTECK